MFFLCFMQGKMGGEAFLKQFYVTALWKSLWKFAQGIWLIALSCKNLYIIENTVQTDRHTHTYTHVCTHQTPHLAYYFLRSMYQPVAHCIFVQKRQINLQQPPVCTLTFAGAPRLAFILTGDVKPYLMGLYWEVT